MNITKYGSSAEQSSVNSDGLPQRAIDGDTNSVYWEGLSCTQTHKEINPWWSVTLPNRHVITDVTIYNRVAENKKDISKRLSPVEVYLEDVGYSTLCGDFTDLESSKQVEIVHINCGKPEIGVKVKVVAPGNKRILTMCELVVYGFSI